MGANPNPDVEQQIASWRGYLARRRAVSAVDVEELEDHLREQVGELRASGLSDEEAFLVAIRRMGSLDALSREFAREHSDRLWKQLVLAPVPEGGRRRRGEILGVLGFAAGAALAVKAPVLFGFDLAEDGSFYLRNLGILVLTFLTGYFARRRHLGGRALAVCAGAFLAAAVLANAYPFEEGGATEVVAAIHLPIALWFVVGFAYVGGDLRSGPRRMDFVRFTGEWAVYYSLIALGGGVLVGITLGAFGAIGLDAARFVEDWVLPAGAAGAVVVAAWLVEAKQSVVENMAPVLTKVFTPLFLLMLVAFLVAIAWTGSGLDIERELLITFDLLLVLVLALLLYSISAREPGAPPTAFDRLQLFLVLGALAVDVLVLVEMLGRVSVWGPSPNKVAALGLNLVLLANLAWSGRLFGGFLLGRFPFARLERWQTTYLPVYPIWATAVVVAIPPVFGFV